MMQKDPAWIRFRKTWKDMRNSWSGTPAGLPSSGQLWTRRSEADEISPAGELHHAVLKTAPTGLHHTLSKSTPAGTGSLGLGFHIKNDFRDVLIFIMRSNIIINAEF